ncbi:hypothetical protein [Pedobacter sp. ASV28]|uniref:hypothetical protein n=1 Tax=Pedobacter sp. ASV28 TaxID=2795123 RepID=UPI0018EAE6F8|nr:hypothetical protein [Pedobacter sp. ASV28]
MKKSITPTPYLLVRARTNSEWDTCEFVLVGIDEEWRDMMAKRMDHIEDFVKDTYFASHVYWESPLGFFANSIDDGLLARDQDWVYVTLEEGEIDKFSNPENTLDTFQFVISKHKGGQYRAFGKHTGEEFWTEDFDLEEIVNLFPKSDNDHVAS